ncbi:hypothetical protein COLO4_23971 [Corchorus olitorius]|uniref:Uncharacterized protein n=1 Tax=Corchorus olitorius TaxID=93759 RepID=A0A1R3IDT4_9ROSI|nr:hypothetical protein COLO4_23971 [Corchorus olitorius]
MSSNRPSSSSSSKNKKKGINTPQATQSLRAFNASRIKSEKAEKHESNVDKELNEVASSLNTEELIMVE